MLRFQAKHPGAKMHLQSVEMKFNYRDTFAVRSPDVYETLLWDVMKMTPRCSCVPTRSKRLGGC